MGQKGFSNRSGVTWKTRSEEMNESKSHKGPFKCFLIRPLWLVLTVSHSLHYFVLTVTCRGGQGKYGPAGFAGKFKSCLRFPD